MALSTDKRYYKIGDVADMLGLPQSTLRFWEQHFAMARPERNQAGTRRYTPRIIENLRILKFLLHDKGLKIEAAKEEMKTNRDGIIRRAEALARLTVVRDKLQELHDSLHKLR